MPAEGPLREVRLREACRAPVAGLQPESVQLEQVRPAEAEPLQPRPGPRPGLGRILLWPRSPGRRRKLGAPLVRRSDRST